MIKIMEKKTETKDLEQPLIHEFNKETLKSSFTPKIITLLIGIVFLGVISGYFFASNSSSLPGGKITQTSLSNGATISKGTVVGSNDTKTFKDTAEGTLKEGGIDGEGAFHLVRPGGDSQNVYLTSSSVDLSKLINRKIKVWGQTQKAQSAGWFMDVGRVEVLE